MNVSEGGSFGAAGGGKAEPQMMFDQQTLADAQLLFKICDTEVDGRLDANELNNHLSDMGVPSHDIDGLFYNLDKNQDGQVTKQEFIVGYNKYHETLDNAPVMAPVKAQSARNSVHKPAPTYADAQLVFNLADTDNNGKLSSDELTAHLTDLGTPAHDIENLLFTLDTNGDTYVSKQEFVSGYNKYYDGVMGSPAVVPVVPAQLPPHQFSSDPSFSMAVDPSDPLDDSWHLQDLQATIKQEPPAPTAPPPVQAAQGWPADPAPSSGADVLLQNAHGFVMMSFDAMAIVAGGTGVVLSSNPAFLKMAFSLGGGDQAQGLWMLQQHFLRDLAMPSGAQIHYASQDLQIHGDTAMLTLNSAIKCMSAPAAPSQSLVWVLTARPGEEAELNVNDPKFADPLIRIMIDPNENRRKKSKAKHGEQTAGGAEAQKLWQKYGERAVKQKKHSDDRIMRAYYRCYNQDCPARLTVDISTNTGNQVDATSGAHNHLVTLETNE